MSELASNESRWDELVLPEEILRRLQGLSWALRNIDEPRATHAPPPRSAIIHGPPGTGKSTIARVFVAEAGLPGLIVRACELSAPYVGQTAEQVRALFARAHAMAPCIVVIDELEWLTTGRSETFGDSQGELVGELIGELERAKRSDRDIFVLALAIAIDDIDAHLLLRLVEQFEIPMPSEAERRRLFKQFLRGHAVDFDLDAVAETLAHQVGTVSGRDIELIVRHGLQQATERTWALSSNAATKAVLREQDLRDQLRPAAALQEMVQ
jgi:transitional endoplasmic reticulum ATPase